jgi:hypothetical protein
MFYQSAKDYALDNGNLNQNPVAAQAMAADAAQALSQAPLQFQASELKNLHDAGNLGEFVQAAMQGEARYGYPPSLEDFARTGTYQAPDGKGAPLDGLSHLMTNVTVADTGGEGSPALLSTKDAQAIDEDMFHSAMDLMHTDSTVESFYQKSPDFKDGLSAIFTTDYDGLVASYLNGATPPDMTSQGLQAFQDFFKDALFTPPLGGRAASTATFFMQDKLNAFIQESNTSPLDSKDKQFKQLGSYNLSMRDYAYLLGEQTKELTLGLAKAIQAVKSDAEATANGKATALNFMLGVLETAVPEEKVGGSIANSVIDQSVNLAAGQSSDPNQIDQQSVDAYTADLAKNGINLDQYRNETIHDLSGKIKDDEDDGPRQHFRNGSGEAGGTSA